MIQLRDYQYDILRRTVESFKAGHRRPLVSVACGSGKSYIFAEMVKRTAGECVVLVHRKELKRQHEKLFDENGITNARIETYQTESRRNYPAPKLLIVDEAHLSRSNTWAKIIERYDTFTVGFSATPCRLDGKPLGDIYDDLIEGVDTKYLIEHNRLAPYEYYAPATVDTSGLRTVGGDYVATDLEKLMCERAIYGNAVRTYEKIAPGERAIAYCVSIRHANEVADAFNSAGIRAEVLHAGTVPGRREAILEDFRAGKINVLCNCTLLSEGISIDEISCAMLLRPTESVALGVQQMMRCMRYLPGKTAKILDFVGNYTRIGLPDDKREWSLTERVEKRRAMDDAGNFTIRTCPRCYKVFKAAPVCPYCGAEYPLHPREIKAKQDIVLARITAEEAARVEEEKKKLRMEVGKARTYPELAKIAAERGYSQGWIYNVLKWRGKR